MLRQQRRGTSRGAGGQRDYLHGAAPRNGPFRIMVVVLGSVLQVILSIRPLNTSHYLQVFSVLA